MLIDMAFGWAFRIVMHQRASSVACPIVKPPPWRFRRTGYGGLEVVLGLGLVNGFDGVVYM